MKQWCIIVLLLLAGLPAKAEHILGGAISYRFVGARGEEETYEVTVKLYAYCGTPNKIFYMIGRRAKIKIYKGMQSSLDMAFLPYDSSRSELNITPICPDEADHTTCSGPLEVYPGVRQITYSGNVTIKGKNDNWHIAFTSGITQSPDPLTYAGVAGAFIQNIDAMPSPLAPDPEKLFPLYLDATLNNTMGPNNSVDYDDGYAPFFCENKPALYSPGARDPDNDQLEFKLISGKMFSSPTIQSPQEAYNLRYISPYTPDTPLAAAPGSFKLNSRNGEIRFLPNQVSNNLVVYQVNEYRKGVKMGSTQKAVTFVTIDNCNNDAPQGIIGDVEELDTSRDDSGALVFSQCEGWDKELKIDIKGSDSNLDNITITHGVLPEEASLTVEGEGTPTPKAHFRWAAAQARPGRYLINLTYSDDGCPLMATQTTAYTIDIRPRPEVQLPADTTLCTGMPLRIETPLQADATYRWSEGDTTNYMVVTRPGDYELRATNHCGTAADKIHIGYIDCKYCLFVPNAFTPNGDGRNDRFVVKAGCPFRTINLQVFNRYGQRLFTSLSLDKTWDGTFNGQPVEQGDYFYVIDAAYLNPGDGPARTRGTVTVLR
ncbi:gliding motility-associated C-terminal domain-containing protein [Taibaiella koreensis]|uniref:gliding motility-associated C-terminal domain-containing protein n=1 Tax=Taibaiella koreensis TaxID=1268548 RepID=UPI000E59AD01|nr:gliding motility-associated C-terminal domain-containing protein [Taibaiella koreensis]